VHGNDGFVELVDEVLLKDLVVTVADLRHGHQHDHVGIHHVLAHLVVEVDEVDRFHPHAALVLVLRLYPVHFLNGAGVNRNLLEGLKVGKSALNGLGERSLLHLLDELVAEDRVQELDLVFHHWDSQGLS